MKTEASIERELRRLEQKDSLVRLLEPIAMTELLTVHLIDKPDTHIHYIDCALIPNSQVEECLSKPTYDLNPTDGKPGAIRYHEKDGTIGIEYWRFGNDDGFEPLVVERSFHGMRPGYFEISEEFRHFHNLFHDQKNNQYIKFDDAGNEELVAIVTENSIKIRVREIRQFLAIKEMHLSIQFDLREHSEFSAKELDIQVALPNDQRNGLSFYGLNYGDLGMDKCRAFSRLLGKRMIEPLAKEKSGFWGYAKETEKSFADFIIGTDSEGENILCSADRKQFWKHPLKPDYLTGVDFRKSVLDKYYQKPDKYSVEDGYLRCGSLWGITIDNHHADKVSAWLGDLGRDLPFTEQLHWKSYNIPPSGGPSSTFFRRQILAEFADSNRAEHNFQHAYEKLGQACSEKLGWGLLMQLSPQDEHHLGSLRIPASEEQKEFDELVMSLTKILIDYLNEGELRKLVNLSKPGEIKPGISLLERVFQDLQIQGEEHIAFLRKLQKLRSKGSAHRKGSEYEDLMQDLGVDNSKLSSIFEKLLQEATRFLEFCIDSVENGGLSIAMAP